MQSLRAFAIIAAGATALGGVDAARADEGTTFRISVESVTGPGTIALPDGSRIAAPISPGLFSVSSQTDLLFAPGGRASAGLERLAEGGDPEPLIKELNLGAPQPLAAAFLHNQEFTITARPGDRLQFAVMFAQSNDLFYAPDAGGIELFGADGTPVSGDVSSRLRLWDAGTEINQPPGVGADQAPRQAAPDAGAAENGAIRLVDDSFVYPAVTDVIQVTVTPGGPLATN